MIRYAAHGHLCAAYHYSILIHHDFEWDIILMSEGKPIARQIHSGATSVAPRRIS